MRVRSILSLLLALLLALSLAACGGSGETPAEEPEEEAAEEAVTEEETAAEEEPAEEEYPHPGADAEEWIGKWFEEESDPLVFILYKVEMGPVTASPIDAGYGDSALVWINDESSLYYDDFIFRENCTYTLDGNEIVMEGREHTFRGTVDGYVMTIERTAAELDGQGDEVVQVLFFTPVEEIGEMMTDEVAAAGSMTEQIASMSEDEQAAYLEKYGPFFNELALRGGGTNEEALEKAISDVKYGHRSYSGMIEFLEGMGFSTEAATYAADNCGADWFQEAAEQAQGCQNVNDMGVTDTSKEDMVRWLMQDGFTQEQAEYGVSQLGG